MGCGASTVTISSLVINVTSSDDNQAAIRDSAMGLHMEPAKSLPTALIGQIASDVISGDIHGYISLRASSVDAKGGKMRTICIYRLIEA